RVVRADSLTALPSNSPVGSRMAIMLGGAAAGAAKTIKETLIAIAAHNFECSPEDLEYHDGSVNVKGAPSKKFSWDQLVGIAHGIGAALYEKFSYTEDGQLASGTFMDYLIPSAMEVPAMAIVDHCTPSPLTTFGQKGSGEAGYLGAPAAIANAVNDALDPLGASIDALPISHLAIWSAIAARKGTAPT